MFRKLLLISLIILAPVHALAALQMPYEHHTKISNIKAMEGSQHSCHQDVTNTLSDEDLSLTQTTACNGCTLCMAFAFSRLNLVMMSDHFSMIFDAGKKTSFMSYDPLGLNKPPIL
jgi:hypothetical protein